MEELCAKIRGREMLVRAPTDRESPGHKKTAKSDLAVFLFLPHGLVVCCVRFAS